MRWRALVSLFLFLMALMALILTALNVRVPLLAGAECVTPAEIRALRASVVDQLRCARLELDLGSRAACDVIPVPACAGSGVDDVVRLVGGARLPSSPVGSEARAQLLCQRTILRATERYADKRILELARGLRQSRISSAFGRVRTKCDGIPVAGVQATVLPTLGGPCADVASGRAGPLDGTRVARCTRGALERLAAAMTGGVLRPNVVLVMTDDQNVASLPNAASLPWMARVSQFRERATDFTNAFVTTPVCGPSRASILSALYAHHHGVLTNYEAAPTLDASTSLATWLHDAGYRTALIGKYINYAIDLHAVPPGWDEWQALISEESGGDGFTDYRIDENGVLVHHGPSPNEYSTDLLAARSVDFIRTHAKEPFFLMFTPFAPHLPAIPAPRHAGSLHSIVPWRPDNWRELDTSSKPKWVRFLQATTPRESFSALDEMRINQLETLLAVDEAFGEIEDTLERLGLTDNTVLAFTSDNGYHWGEHWWNSKFTQYEESVRVPLLVSYPALAPAPATHDELVVNIDLAPTFAELAGAVVPPGRDGRSFAALLAGSSGAVRDDFLIQDWASFIVPAWEGVRGTRFKYVHTDATGGVTEELYDEIADPGELANLAVRPAYANILRAMRRRLAELLKEGTATSSDAARAAGERR